MTLKLDIFQTIKKDGNLKYTGACLSVAQAQAEVSGVECTILKNSIKIMSYTPNPKKWTSFKQSSYSWGNK
jgi:hypothetical protein